MMLWNALNVEPELCMNPGWFFKVGSPEKMKDVMTMIITWVAKIVVGTFVMNAFAIGYLTKRMSRSSLSLPMGRG